MEFLAAFNIVLEILVVIRLWRCMHRAYVGFAAYLSASVLSSAFMIALLTRSLEIQVHDIWIVSEILIALAGCWVVWESATRLKRMGGQSIDAITVILFLVILGTLITWGYVRHGYIHDWPLESIFTLKATVEFFFAAMLTGMLFSGHIPNRLNTLEAKHAILLIVYFALNSTTFFAYSLVTLNDVLAREFRPLSWFLLSTCTGCLVGWLWLFRPRGHQTPHARAHHLAHSVK